MNVEEYDEGFVGDIVRLPALIPLMLFVITRSVRLAIDRLHKLVTYKLKLMGTPTCTSKQPLTG